MRIPKFLLTAIVIFTSQIVKAQSSVQIGAGNELYFYDNGQIRSLDNNHRILFRRTENIMEFREFGNVIFSPGSETGAQTGKMFMGASGSMGIGTLNPNAMLSLGKGGGKKFLVYDHDTPDGPQAGMGIDMSGSPRELTIFHSTSDGNDGVISFGKRREGLDTYKEAMRITAVGNVGIGTNTPQATLHISKAEPASFLVENTTDGYASLNLKSNGKTWHLSKRTGADGDKLSLYYHNGTDYSSPYLTVTTDGNIGINTTDTKTYKLAVNGSAIFTKVIVKEYNNWPDYVFHANYRLRPLSEVEQYINKYHHLPEVPTAEEVEKNGVDVGNNQATLLKKIEELTLYVIEQNKKIEALEAKIQSLENKDK